MALSTQQLLYNTQHTHTHTPTKHTHSCEAAYMQPELFAHSVVLQNVPCSLTLLSNSLYIIIMKIMIKYDLGEQGRSTVVYQVPDKLK